MGRKHYSERIPQHSRHAKQREKWRSGETVVPEAFGIRRPLEGHSMLLLRNGIRELQLVGELPEDLRVDPRIYVPLLPLRVFGKQALKGLVSEYDLQEMSRRLERRCGGTNHQPATAEIKGVTMNRGKNLHVTLVSPEIETERASIATVLGGYGLRGLQRFRGESVLHMGLASCSDPLGLEDQQRIEQLVHHTIDDIQHQEEPLVFGGWEIYPDPQRLVA